MSGYMLYNLNEPGVASATSWSPLLAKKLNVNGMDSDSAAENTQSRQVIFRILRALDFLLYLYIDQKVKYNQ